MGHSLGIELAKTMSLNYSNQETSVTVGESVRDEDGMCFFHTRAHFLAGNALTLRSLHPSIHRPRRDQRWPHGTPYHDQCLQDCLRSPYHSRHSQLSLRAPGQERQVPRSYLRETNRQHAANRWVQPRHHHGFARVSDSRLLQRSSR